MVTRAGFRNFIQYEWDDTNMETVASSAALQFDDDFIGAGHTAGVPAAGAPAAGYPWVKKIVGAGPPTQAEPRPSAACTPARLGATASCARHSSSPNFVVSMHSESLK